MKFELLSQTVKSLYGHRRPVCIIGPPGGGKTSLVKQVAEDLDIGFILVHLPTRVVEDFGLPVFDRHPDTGKTGVSMTNPHWFPSIDNDKVPENGILLFDDRNQAGPDLQKVLAHIIQERDLNGHKLKPGWMIVSTGNRIKDRAGASRVLSHLRDRETTVSLDTDPDTWIKYATRNGVNPMVTSFIRFRPDLLHPEPKNTDEIHPSPRSWTEGVSKAIGVVPAEAEYETIVGDVGEGVGIEFTGFLKTYRDLPDIDKWIADPQAVKKKTIDKMNLSTQHALVGAVAHRTTLDNFTNVVELCGKMKREFDILCIQTVVLSATDVIGFTNHPAWEIWSKRNKDVVS